MLRLAIVKLVHPVIAAPVKRQRTSVSKTLSKMPVGCHLLTVCFAILHHSLFVVVNKPHKHVKKRMFGLQRCHCRKEACTCDYRASRKMSARAVFMVRMSARVFLSIVCIALTVVRLLLFVHAV